MRDERGMAMGVVGGGELSPELRARLERELEKGERVVWSAAPLPGAYARGAWAFAVFGVLFAGFAVFWMVMAGGMAWLGGQAATANGVSAVPFSLFPLCGLPFLAVGVGIMTAPVWLRKRAAKVVYAVTDRRAIVITPVAFRGESARSFTPAQLGSIERIERADGSGNLVFAREMYGSPDSDGGSRVRARWVGFIGVADVKGAERAVRGLVDSRVVGGQW